MFTICRPRFCFMERGSCVNSKWVLLFSSRVSTEHQFSSRNFANLEKCQKQSLPQSHLKNSYRNYSIKELKKRSNKKFFNITWKGVGVLGVVGSSLLFWLWRIKAKQEEELEKRRRRSVGNFLVGGPWQLTDMFGKPRSEKDFLGRWVLIYFGFTHCPDICPDELEKMCNVAKKLREDSKENICTLFFSVDPERDTPDVIQKYCADFSPDLLGLTGTKEEVDKVCKTFRVYHTQGPKDTDDDYIVDHTIMMYLMDPEGLFVDYYGQYRKYSEIADAIHMHIMKYNRGKDKGWW